MGGKTLEGEVCIDAAKNSLLPIIAACIMVKGEVLLKNVPRYSDVIAMCKILRHLGGKAYFLGDDSQNDLQVDTCEKTEIQPELDGVDASQTFETELQKKFLSCSDILRREDLYIDCRQLSASDVPNELASCVRSSIFTLGPILGRQGVAKVSYPGGCDIGLRPIDIHLSGVKQLGCKVVDKNGYIYADATGLKGEDVMLSFPSVGATENIMMLAALANGVTRIFNPAREPEIVDLQNFLNACGADITGAGSNMILVKGVAELHGCSFQALSDRIEAGTLLIAGAMCGGEVVLKNAVAKHNSELIAKLSKTSCKIYHDNDKIVLKKQGQLQSFGEIETAVYPGFPTDLQAQSVALAAVCNGYSLVIETLFESRNKHIGELLKMGCDIRCKNGVCIIHGKDKIYGADVVAHDLRGGAAMVLAGLYAEGYTTVSGVEMIDRGYYRMEEKLCALGGDVKRIKCEKKVDYCN